MVTRLVWQTDKQTNGQINRQTDKLAKVKKSLLSLCDGGKIAGFSFTPFISLHFFELRLKPIYHSPCALYWLQATIPFSMTQTVLRWLGVRVGFYESFSMNEDLRLSRPLNHALRPCSTYSDSTRFVAKLSDLFSLYAVFITEGRCLLLLHCQQNVLAHL